MSVVNLGTFAVLTLLTPLILVRPTEAQNPVDMGFEVGQPFPTIAFPALEDGRPRSITEFRGKKLILHIFASW